MRACSGVGADPLEAVGNLVIGKGLLVARAVDVPGVPGDGAIQLIKDPVAGHEGLARAALLPRAAVIDDGAGTFFPFQILLDGKSRRKGTHSQKVVAAAMSRTAGD